VTESLEEFVKRACMSDWEGCMCVQVKGHKGLHRCPYEPCGCEWTDEQSDEWWEKFKSEYKVEYTENKE
jgi:hypothetical protein